MNASTVAVAVTVGAVAFQGLRLLNAYSRSTAAFENAREAPVLTGKRRLRALTGYAPTSHGLWRSDITMSYSSTVI